MERISIESRNFINTHPNLERIGGRNDFFVRADNPNAQNVINYVLSNGGSVGYNLHNCYEYTDWDTGLTEYHQQIPVYVFTNLKMSKGGFSRLLRDNGWKM